MFKQNSLLTIAVLTALILMSGCSQSDGNSTSESSNTETLLGTDSNNNGVRDDVEAKIIQRFKRPVEQAVMMQYAKRTHDILKDPVAAAKSEALDRELFNSEACEGYLRNNHNVDFDRDYGNPIKYLNDIVYNNKERIEAYLKFNRGKSGGSYSVPNPWKDYVESACDFNITEMIELEK